jgi:hypothetical protein
MDVEQLNRCWNMNRFEGTFTNELRSIRCKRDPDPNTNDLSEFRPLREDDGSAESDEGR